jgi:GTP-binding protein YchF
MSGKTTLFELISGVSQSSLINIASVKVKDENIDNLSNIFKPKKTTYAEFNVFDYNIAQDASNSLLGSANLVSKYRELDAIAIILGVINNKEEVLPYLNEIISEMAILDTIVLEAKIERMKKTKFDKIELELYESIISKLENNETIKIDSFTKEELKMLSSFGLLCLKPKIVVINVAEDLTSEKFDIKDFLYVVISASIEKEISTLSEEDKKSFLKDFGFYESAKDRFINKLYESMNLISFYTVGEDEVRAWAIKEGLTAVSAAGKIHSDIERGFIRAETISYSDFIKHGSEQKAKSAGVARSEGKDYIVKHGDIIHFKFNV